MDIKPHKEPEHVPTPHDGVDKGVEMSMSNCKTMKKRKVKRAISGIAFVLHDA